jgi:hypothetical protein
MKISSNGKFLGVFIKKGNKKIVENYFFELLSILKFVLKNNKFNSYYSIDGLYRKFPVVYFSNLLKDLEPIVVLRSKKKGGIVYKVPSYSRSKRFKIKTVVQWFSKLSLKKTKVLSLEKLFDNLYITLQNKGPIIDQKLKLYKTSIDNRPYLKFVKKQNIHWVYRTSLKKYKVKNKRWAAWIQKLVHERKKYKYRLKRWDAFFKRKKPYITEKQIKSLKRTKPIFAVKNKWFSLPRLRDFYPKWLFLLKRDQLLFLFAKFNVLKTVGLKNTLQNYLNHNNNNLRTLKYGKKRFLAFRKRRKLKNKLKFKNVEKRKRNPNHRYSPKIWRYWKRNKAEIYRMNLNRKFSKHVLIKDARKILKAFKMRVYNSAALGIFSVLKNKRKFISIN